MSLSIGNWPPGYPLSIEPPESLNSAISDAEARLADAKQQLSAWYAETRNRKNVAWIEWHTANGWPDDAGYKARLIHAARDKLAVPTS